MTSYRENLTPEVMRSAIRRPRRGSKMIRHSRRALQPLRVTKLNREFTVK